MRAFKVVFLAPIGSECDAKTENFGVISHTKWWDELVLGIFYHSPTATWKFVHVGSWNSFGLVRPLGKDYCVACNFHVSLHIYTP